MSFVPFSAPALATTNTFPPITAVSSISVVQPRRDHAHQPRGDLSGVYVQGRGALRRELTACLRTGRALRVPRARSRREGQGLC